MSLCVTVPPTAMLRRTWAQVAARALCALLAVLPLGGCGFHLRGGAGGAAAFPAASQAGPVQLPPVQLQIDRARTPLAAAIANAISNTDIRVVGADPAEGGSAGGSAGGGTAGGGAAAEGAADSVLARPWRVRVSEQNEERRGRTLTRGIQVAEYELTVELAFEVLDATGTQLHPAQRLAASRVYSREQENLLTNEAEEDVLWDELRRDVAAQLAAAIGVQLSSAAQQQAGSARPTSP